MLPDIMYCLKKPMYNSPSRRRPLAPSLDRIDARRGYSLGNVQLVLQLINMAKSDCGNAAMKNLLVFAAKTSPVLEAEVKRQVRARTSSLKARERAVLAAEKRLLERELTLAEAEQRAGLVPMRDGETRRVS